MKKTVLRGRLLNLRSGSWFDFAFGRPLAKCDKRTKVTLQGTYEHPEIASRDGSVYRWENNLQPTCQNPDDEIVALGTIHYDEDDEGYWCRYRRPRQIITIERWGFANTLRREED